MTKTMKKGFTLTELIVVIAIIAILAAVLIPTSISFINKAKKSNDGQLAAQMTKEIGWYCLENDVNQNDLLGTDIRTILLFRGYDLVPKTDDWTFWYNKTDKKVELIENKDSNIQAGDFDTINANPSDPTNIYEDYYLLGKGETQAEQIVNHLCNIDFSSLETFTDFSSNSGKFQTYTNYFNPSNTLYLTNSNGLTKASTIGSITKVVALEKTVVLPMVSFAANYLGTLSTPLPRVIIAKENNSNLSSLYPSISSVEEKSVATIDISNFTDFIGSGSFFEFTLGEHFEENSKQEIKDELIGEDEISEDSKDILVFVRKFTVSYYNEKGLYARGSTTYSISQELENN